jgi:hypothetical protein
MQSKSNNKPGPKPEHYKIEDAEIRKIPGAENITTERQYQKLLAYLEKPVGDRDPCFRIGATVPPSPQISRNASAKLKFIKIFDKHDVKYSIQYNSPRRFVIKVVEGNFTDALLKDLRDISEIIITKDDFDKSLIDIQVNPVNENARNPSQSIWVVTYPNGNVEVIKRLQDPRAAHRWMTNERRPWNNKKSPIPLDLSQI